MVVLVLLAVLGVISTSIASPANLEQLPEVSSEWSQDDIEALFDRNNLTITNPQQRYTCMSCMHVQ